MNRIVKILMISDIFVFTGFGLIEPILAIFMKDNVVGGTIFAVGIASTIYLVTKSLVQLPFSRYVDNHDHKLIWLKIGSGLIVLVPFLYMFAKEIHAIYMIQIIYGIGAGLAYPAWLGIWSANIDKNHTSFEWSFYYTLIGLGTAMTAAIGAAVAEFIGFNYTFLLVGILSFIGCSLLYMLEKKNVKKGKEIDQHHYHKKRKLLHSKYH